MAYSPQKRLRKIRWFAILSTLFCFLKIEIFRKYSNIGRALWTSFYKSDTYLLGLSQTWLVRSLEYTIKQLCWKSTLVLHLWTVLTSFEALGLPCIFDRECLTSPAPIGSDRESINQYSSFVCKLAQSIHWKACHKARLIVHHSEWYSPRDQRTRLTLR